jgi:drug/metabolite transporter (DMT)-like permease
MATLGLFAGLAGVLLIMGARLDGGADVTGVLIIVCAVLALTLATLLVQGASSGDNVIMVVGLQMLVGSAVLLPLSVATESWIIDWQWQLIVAFTYTTLVPGLLATITWFMLVNRIGATRAATFHFLNPFLGVAIASFILGEALGLTDMLGVVVIMAGILAVQLSRRA